MSKDKSVSERDLDKSVSEPPSVEALLATLVDKLVETSKANALSPEVLETILSRVGVSSADAMKARLQRENETHPHVSAYNPLGDIANPRPELRIPTYFCGGEEKAERLTRTEIELYNALTSNREARNGKWRARIVRQPGGLEQLFVEVPAKTHDEIMDIPPLVMVLSVLNGGPDITDVHNLVKQIENLKALAVKQGATTDQLEKALLSA